MKFQYLPQLLKSAFVRRILPTAIMTLAFFTCCSENKSTNENYHEQQLISIPLNIGATWVYETHDSIRLSTDTITVSVVDTFTMNGNILLYQWRYSTQDSISMRYAALSGDTLVFYDDTIKLKASEYFIFPLTLGKIWSGPYPYGGDSTHISDSGQISVPAGDFMNGAKIDRKWDQDFEGGAKTSSKWFVPDIGFVYIVYLRWGNDGGGHIYFRRNEAWELISFESI